MNNVTLSGRFSRSVSDDGKGWDIEVEDGG